jgi:hypothetical protein
MLIRRKGRKANASAAADAASQPDDEDEPVPKPSAKPRKPRKPRSVPGQPLPDASSLPLPSPSRAATGRVVKSPAAKRGPKAKARTAAAARKLAAETGVLADAAGLRAESASSLGDALGNLGVASNDAMTEASSSVLRGDMSATSLYGVSLQQRLDARRMAGDASGHQVVASYDFSPEASPNVYPGEMSPPSPSPYGVGLQQRLDAMRGRDGGCDGPGKPGVLPSGAQAAGIYPGAGTATPAGYTSPGGGHAILLSDSGESDRLGSPPGTFSTDAFRQRQPDSASLSVAASRSYTSHVQLDVNPPLLDDGQSVSPIGPPGRGPLGVNDGWLSSRGEPSDCHTPKGHEASSWASPASPRVRGDADSPACQVGADIVDLCSPTPVSYRLASHAGLRREEGLPFPAGPNSGDPAIHPPRSATGGGVHLRGSVQTPASPPSPEHPWVDAGEYEATGPETLPRTGWTGEEGRGREVHMGDHVGASPASPSVVLVDGGESDAGVLVLTGGGSWRTAQSRGVAQGSEVLPLTRTLQDRAVVECCHVTRLLVLSERACG